MSSRSRQTAAAAEPEVIRSAIYTRKSTEEGLSQDFNSLDNQRERCELFIGSQGWQLVSDRFDDGGFTGGNTKRPALQRLLCAVKEGLVDRIVVYKMDRLTRSLRDFLDLAELFEQYGASIVSVTEMFDTSTSSGRLFLHILLSFGQFEREQIAERTQHKMSAARRKGKRTGGTPPLGYDIVDTKLVINEAEAQQVRMIFQLYLEHEAILSVVQELNRRGRLTKSWTTRRGIVRHLAGSEGTLQQVQEISELYGLDRPLVIQYLDWIWGFLHGDFGRSIFTGEPVIDMLASALPVTIRIVFFGTLLSVVIGLLLGTIAALKANTAIDRGIVSFAIAVSSIPSFFFALVVMMVFSVILQWTPVAGSESWEHYILPVLTVALGSLMGRTRLMRTNMVTALRSDYIRTARAMGHSTRTILFKYAFRVAIVPLVAITLIQLGNQLGRTVIIETVFGMNGLGTEVTRAILRQDFPVVQATVLLISLIFIALTIVADIINSKLDPRIRLS